MISYADCLSDDVKTLIVVASMLDYCAREVGAMEQPPEGLVSSLSATRRELARAIEAHADHAPEGIGASELN